MNSRHNLRVSVAIAAFTLLVITIIVAFKITHKDDKTAPDDKKVATADIAFISSVPDINDAALDVRQAYSGAQSSSVLLDKDINIYYPKKTLEPAATQTETGASQSLANQQPGSSTTDDSANATSNSSLNEEYSKLIKQASEAGAKIIICPDASFSETIYNVQNNYTNTYFLLINGIPHNADKSDNTINYNVIPLTYDESEAGFIAGYSLVYEGIYNLYFICDNTTESIHYAYGFIQGAELASKDLKLSSVNLTYRCVSDAKEAATAASEYYSTGASIIACAGDNIIPSVYDVTTSQNKHMIICGNTYSSIEADSPIVALAMMDITKSVEDVVTKFFSGPVSGGKIICFSASNNAVCYSFSDSYFKRFSEDIYKSLYSKLANDEIKLVSDTTVLPEDLDLEIVKVKTIISSEVSSPKQTKTD